MEPKHHEGGGESPLVTLVSSTGLPLMLAGYVAAVHRVHHHQPGRSAATSRANGATSPRFEAAKRRLTSFQSQWCRLSSELPLWRSKPVSEDERNLNEFLCECVCVCVNPQCAYVTPGLSSQPVRGAAILLVWPRGHSGPPCAVRPESDHPFSQGRWEVTR